MAKKHLEQYQKVVISCSANYAELLLTKLHSIFDARARVQIGANTTEQIHGARSESANSGFSCFCTRFRLQKFSLLYTLNCLYLSRRQRIIGNRDVA